MSKSVESVTAAFAKRCTLEETLRHFDLIARLELYVQRRVLAELSDVEDRHLVTAKKPNALLVGEIGEAAGSVYRRQQSDVFGEWNSARVTNGAADVNKS